MNDEYMNGELINKREQCIIGMINTFIHCNMIVLMLLVVSVTYFTFILVVSPCLNEKIQAKFPATIVKNNSTECTDDKANDSGSSVAYDNRKSTTYDDDIFSINCICRSVYNGICKITCVAIIHSAVCICSYKLFIWLKVKVMKRPSESDVKKIFITTQRRK